MAYAVAGLATASGGATSAEAEIHYSGLVDYKFDKKSRGYEVHAFPLSRGVYLEGFRYVRGTDANSADLLIEGGAVSHGFRIYSWSFAPSVADTVPRGSVVSQGSFNRSSLGRLQDYACEFPTFLEPVSTVPAFASIAAPGCNMAGCGSNGAVVPSANPS
jgi:hypothetical protein